MTKKILLITILATSILFLGLSSDAQADYGQPTCTVTYGGGEICGEHTPVDTAADTNILYTSSAILYSLGLGNFILAKNAHKFVPFLS